MYFPPYRLSTDRCFHSVSCLFSVDGKIPGLLSPRSIRRPRTSREPVSLPTRLNRTRVSRQEVTAHPGFRTAEHLPCSGRATDCMDGWSYSQGFHILRASVGSSTLSDSAFPRSEEGGYLQVLFPWNWSRGRLLIQTCDRIPIQLSFRHLPPGHSPCSNW